MNQPPGTHLAQFNVATAVDDLDSDRLRGFMAAIHGVNRRAERSPGFVWRLQDEAGGATGLRVRGDPRLVVNLSVWTTPEDLERFVWGTLHGKVYAKKAQWFEPPKAHHLVMWWVPAGHRPSLDEAVARLDQLDATGPSAEAFGWESLPSVQLWRTQRCARGERRACPIAELPPERHQSTKRRSAQWDGKRRRPRTTVTQLRPKPPRPKS